MEILKIEESGLIALVNKHIKEKVYKDETKASRNQEFLNDAVDNALQIDNDAALLLSKDEQHERAMVRSLLEFGNKPWNDEETVAKYMFAEIAENQLSDLIDNKNLVRLLETYKIWYDNGIEPTTKNFLYHDDVELSTLAVSIMDFNYEISPNWSAHFEGHIPTREDLFKEEVFSTLNYLKLRKIKRLIDENQLELEKAIGNDEQMICLQTHQHLKQVEMELTKQLGTVIFR